MARQVTTVIVSDLSGERIPEDKAWRMELTPPDGRRNKVALDISEEEAQAFVGKGQEVKRRGRRPGTTMPKTGNRRRRQADPDPK
jgi:hypothetical protein